MFLWSLDIRAHSAYEIQTQHYAGPTLMIWGSRSQTLDSGTTSAQVLFRDFLGLGPKVIVLVKDWLPDLQVITKSNEGPYKSRSEEPDILFMLNKVPSEWRTLQVTLNLETGHYDSKRPESFVS